MRPVLETSGGTWIFAPATPTDRELAHTGVGDLVSDGIRLRIVDLPREEHREHYETVCNAVLAPLFHYLFRLSHAPELGPAFARAWRSYRRVNHEFGRVVSAHDGAGAVLIEDMHLMLVAAAAGAAERPLPPLVYFHHLPWCAPDYFGVLPSPVRQEILEGLLAHDSVAFHSRRWAHAFAGCCERFLPGVVASDDSVAWRGRSVRVVAAPAPLDVGTVRELADAGSTREWSTRFEQLSKGRATLVRVDRADLWKNVLRGLAAYRLLLERRSDLVRSAWFLAVLSPTRMWLPEYREYLKACEEAAAEINRVFGRPGADAVTIHFPDPDAPADRHRALGALAIADAVLINSLFDGLNLVAKEAVVAGRRRPALILSENVGACEELGTHALIINPFDIQGTSEALEHALDMPADERQARWRQLAATVVARTSEDWIGDRLGPLASSRSS
jgi:trehalose 6-phosphate synthase